MVAHVSKALSASELREVCESTFRVVYQKGWLGLSLVSGGACDGICFRTTLIESNMSQVRSEESPEKCIAMDLFFPRWFSLLLSYHVRSKDMGKNIIKMCIAIITVSTLIPICGDVSYSVKIMIRVSLDKRQNPFPFWSYRPYGGPKSKEVSTPQSPRMRGEPSLDL